MARRPLRSLTPTRDREGSYAILLLLSLPMLLGVGAVAVDLSYQKVVRTELQAAADIAVHAGIAELDGTWEGVQAAKATAIRAAARNTAGGESVDLRPDQIQTGWWDEDQGRFVQTNDPADIEALRIVTSREDVLSSFAAVAFNQPVVGAKGHSTGVNIQGGDAGAVACYLPLAIPQCFFDIHDDLSQVTLTLNPAGIDNVGWGRVGATPNASWTRDQLRYCSDGVARVGDDAGLQNGVVSSALAEMIDIIEEGGSTWNTDNLGPLPAQNGSSAISSAAYGNTLEGAIIVFDGGPGYCQGKGGSFNGYEEIVGFAWATVYDVRTKGGAKDKNIFVRIDPMADEVIGIAGGGQVAGGVKAQGKVALVQ
ncbi:MAG: hypothetical protein H6742_07655 [Alphaproteobacteria bacterium]|nr:hypothetical protein [Alphaproteobacteria bacterium]